MNNAIILYFFIFIIVAKIFAQNEYYDKELITQIAYENNSNQPICEENALATKNPIIPSQLLKDIYDYTPLSFTVNGITNGAPDNHKEPDIDLNDVKSANIIIDDAIQAKSFSGSTVENIAVKYKTLGATEWTLPELFTTAGLGSRNPEHVRTDQMPEGMAGHQSQVRFRAHGANSYNINGWGLDDIHVHVQLPLPLASGVRIKITDITGREITHLSESRLSEGVHSFEITRDQFLNSGIYFVHACIIPEQDHKKIITKRQKLIVVQ